MPSITNFTEAQNVLRPFYDNSRTPYTLDAMRKLLIFLDNPQEKIKVIHVAGTSGKTSTAYYSAALLQQAGYSVGLSVSPHVDTMNERVQVNGLPIPESEFCLILGEFLTLLEQCETKPSYFELMVGLAFWEFARRGVDYAVMEVGLGGLLDATNTIERPDKVCLITDIGFDHTEILGDTLEKIATQKAGIIMPGNAVFMYEQGFEIMHVARSTVSKQQATLEILSNQDTVVLKNLPLFQQRNLGLACRAVKFVLARDDRKALTETMIKTASDIVVPARLERFNIGDKTIVLDGSHNQQKMQAFVTSLLKLYPGQKFAALVGFVQGHDTRWQGALDELLASAEHISLTTFHSEKDLPKTSMSTNELIEYCKAHAYDTCDVIADPARAYYELLQRPEKLLVVTGSFYLMNHIRPLVIRNES